MPGPMRAVYGKEELFDHLPGRESAAIAVQALSRVAAPSAGPRWAASGFTPPLRAASRAAWA